MIARQISTAREHFGSDADLPVDVAMEKMRAMNNSLLKVFERLLSKGYTPGKDESAIDFYARAMKIEMGKTRVPGA